MAGILLDTSYLFWFMEGSDNLSESEIELIQSQDTSLHVSAVSIWEMRLKFEKRDRSGRPTSPFDPKDAISVLDGLEVTFLQITVDHAACPLDDPLEDNKDPFDRLLLVQAQVEGLKFLTRDRKIIGHPLAIQAAPP